MTRKEFESRIDEVGYDIAIDKLHKETMNSTFCSFSELLDIAIQFIEIFNLTSAMNILTVVKNPPKDDSGFYFYDKDIDEPPVPLTTTDLIEKYIGFAEPTNLVTVHIAVLDFCTGCIKKYTQKFKEGWQTKDVEYWLVDNTDYKDSQCYYMASKEPIEVIEE